MSSAIKEWNNETSTSSSTDFKLLFDFESQWTLKFWLMRYTQIIEQSISAKTWIVLWLQVHTTFTAVMFCLYKLKLALYVSSENKETVYRNYKTFGKF